MNVALWIGIWLLFSASAFGMLLSALLWSEKARSMTVAAWVKASVALEDKHYYHKLALRVYDDTLTRLVLGSSKQVSVRKVGAWGLAASSMFYVAMAGEGYWLDSTTIIGTAISIPMHCAIEYFVARSVVRRFYSSNEEAPLRRTLLSLIAGTRSLLIVGLGLAAIGVICRWLYHNLLKSTASTTTTDWPADLLIYSIANGPASLVAYLTSDTAGQIEPAQVVLLSASSSAALVVLLLLIACITAFWNRPLTRAMASGCEALSALNPRTLLSGSLFLFSVSTGLMQAYTFTRP